MRLNQALAVEPGAKSRAARTLTDAHHTLQKSVLLDGIAREYQPVDEDGERLPPESKRVQVQVSDMIERVRVDLVKLFDVVATKEVANRSAKADIVLEGSADPLLADVPVTYLLFLEHQLVDLLTFVRSLPVLDPTKDWTFNPTTGVFEAPVVETAKTKKVPRNHVKAEATDKHPAQVDVYHEDVVVGYWKTRLSSGAMAQTTVTDLTRRIVALQEAVKKAKEEANSMTVEPQSFAKPLFDFILG